ncbi:putative zn 2cys6 transcription factor [Diplodia seriata]|nr:putative zn 2cys6 transcription factor [Diplodia seriata]
MESMQDVEIIDPDVEDIGGKLESYMKRIGPMIYEAETSPFMKPTLVMAHRLSVENKEGIESKESLLSKVLELWVATRVLAEPDLKFQLFFNHTQPPFKDPVIMTPQDLESVPQTSRFPIELATRSEAYRLIDAQILGAMEKRAANLSKFVMNDLERRLLQRQQANPFETFLVSMILLACVERMCWLFKRWENPVHVPARTYSVPPPDLKTELEKSINAANAAATAAENAQNNVDHNVPMPDAPPPQEGTPSMQSTAQAATDAANALFSQPHPNRWPLDKPPASYSQQGERFSDILHMLLKMRGVPPKTTTEPITNIVVPIDNMTNNQTTNATINPKSDALAKEWFAEVKITPMYLAERRNAVFIGNDPREWECFYVSKILVHNGIVEGTGRLVP